MNRSISRNDRFDSDNGIYRMIYEGYGERVSSVGSLSERILARLSATVRTLTGSTAKRIAKVCTTAFCLIGMTGVAGAIEVGNLSLFSGLGICVLLLGLEVLCLRGKKDKSHSSFSQDQNG